MCRKLIIETQQDLVGVIITGKHAKATRVRLNKRLTEALEKLNKGKFSGALGRLINVRHKVLDLASDNQISQADANLLIDDVNAAISCIDDLVEDDDDDKE